MQSYRIECPGPCVLAMSVDCCLSPHRLLIPRDDHQGVSNCEGHRSELQGCCCSPCASSALDSVPFERRKNMEGPFARNCHRLLLPVHRRVFLETMKFKQLLSVAMVWWTSASNNFPFFSDRYGGAFGEVNRTHFGSGARKGLLLCSSFIFYDGFQPAKRMTRFKRLDSEVRGNGHDGMNDRSASIPDLARLKLQR